VIFFRIQNLKAQRNLNSDRLNKYIPINSDLFDLMAAMGYHEKATGVLTSHSTIKVLESCLIGPQILLAVKKGF
jgi:hypothetical protein